MKKNIILILLLSITVLSCASKKDILYFQDSKAHAVEKIIYNNAKIQPNDILSIIVGALVPETAYPYNIQTSQNGININLDILKLQGYLVDNEGSIDFPVLGNIKVLGETVENLELAIQNRLEKGGHLIEPTVNVRLLNAKVTILGEVRAPGTYSFTEQNISLPQALGYAGDLTINGKRTDIKVIREEDGMRTIEHIDLTSADWFGSPFYYIRPNDVIVVSPNAPKVKSAGFIGNAGTVLTIASLILTSVVLITR